MLVNGRYSSFSEVATAMGMASPVKKVDQNKQQSRQKKFCSYHKCKTCGEPMIFVEGTNIMTCSNPQCKGIKHEFKDKEGNKVVKYSPSYDLLADKYASMASSLFDYKE